MPADPQSDPPGLHAASDSPLRGAAAPAASSGSQTPRQPPRGRNSRRSRRTRRRTRAATRAATASFPRPECRGRGGDASEGTLMVGDLQPGPPRAVTARGRPNVAATNRVSPRRSAGREGRRGAIAQRRRPREQSPEGGREDADVTRTWPTAQSPQLDPQQPGGTGRPGARRRNGTQPSPWQGKGRTASSTPTGWVVTRFEKTPARCGPLDTLTCCCFWTPPASDPAPFEADFLSKGRS